MNVGDKVKVVYNADLFNVWPPTDDRIDIPGGSIGEILEVFGKQGSSNGNPMTRGIKAQFSEGIAYFPEQMIELGLVEIVT